MTRSRTIAMRNYNILRRLEKWTPPRQPSRRVQAPSLPLNPADHSFTLSLSSNIPEHTFERVGNHRVRHKDVPPGSASSPIVAVSPAGWLRGPQVRCLSILLPNTTRNMYRHDWHPAAARYTLYSSCFSREPCLIVRAYYLDFELSAHPFLSCDLTPRPLFFSDGRTTRRVRDRAILV